LALEASRGTFRQESTNLFEELEAFTRRLVFVFGAEFAV
jgi:hypothetical protein